jgi:hypothetical protein
MDWEGANVHTSSGILPASGWMTGTFDQQVLLEDRQNEEIFDPNGRGTPTSLESEREKGLEATGELRTAF